jgi:hypothetical protein
VIILQGLKGLVVRSTYESRLVHGQLTMGQNGLVVADGDYVLLHGRDEVGD